MAPIANHVKPGDLVLSSLINLLIDKISSIDDRVTALEGGSTSSSGAVVITGLSPAGPIQVGQVLTVSGRNFGFPPSGLSKRWATLFRLNAFQAGSNDQQLLFVIPTTIADVPAQGRSASHACLEMASCLRPNRPFSSYSAFSITGGVEVNYVGPITGAITPG